MAMGMDSTSRVSTSNLSRMAGSFMSKRMHPPEPTPDIQVETRFEGDGTGTLTVRMTLPVAQTRAAMFATGMEAGKESSYVRLEGTI
jgi:hypothetical protein